MSITDTPFRAPGVLAAEMATIDHLSGGRLSGLKDPKRSALRIAKYNLAGWIGIQDSPDEIKQWRGAIQRELEVTNLLVGTTGQITDRLKEEILPKVEAA